MINKTIKYFNNTRSKIQHLDYKALILFLRKIVFTERNDKLVLHRAVKISNIFRLTQAYTYQGRSNVRVPLSQHRVGFSLGMFAATKKPFNYRPKIKKQKR
jgi:ribosomal protein S19